MTCPASHFCGDTVPSILKISRCAILGYALQPRTFSSHTFSYSSAHARQVATLASGSPALAGRVAAAVLKFQVPLHCLGFVISSISFHRPFDFSILVCC